jgi:3-hydroxymyristoyl/3-hydroxydecanoyl-(acyl carrier protein) dehydratase
MTERVFQADHPALPGHFPGNPVVPGALLLCEAVRAIEAGTGLDLSSFRIASAKFHRPTRPGDRILVEFSRAGGSFRFTCVVEGAPVLTGRLSCRALLKVM